jgi:RNA polymerase sigma factor (sigma-70 family)
MPPAAEQLASRLFLGPALRTQSDRRLVTLVREGYEAAFEEIVRRYRKPLDRFAASFVGGRSEDITQDAFSKALLALRGSGQEIELRPWLYRIVRNTALNNLRDGPPATADLDEALAGAHSAAEEVERREELTELTERLRALPDPQRAAIVMRELEGLSHEEIAAALGVTGGAARQAIHRGRQALRGGFGLLLPLPLLRLLAGHGVEAAAGAGAGGALAAGAAGASGGAAGTAGALGGAGALKAGLATVLIAGSVGAGVAVEQRGHHGEGKSGTTRAEIANAGEGGGSGPGPGLSGGAGAQGSGSERGGDRGSGEDGHGGERGGGESGGGARGGPGESPGEPGEGGGPGPRHGPGGGSDTPGSHGGGPGPGGGSGHGGGPGPPSGGDRSGGDTRSGAPGGEGGGPSPGTGGHSGGGGGGGDSGSGDSGGGGGGSGSGGGSPGGSGSSGPAETPPPPPPPSPEEGSGGSGSGEEEDS